jgi:hypothetical protein
VLEVVEENAVVDTGVDLHEGPGHVRLEDSLGNMLGAQVGAMWEECLQYGPHVRCRLIGPFMLCD